MFFWGHDIQVNGGSAVPKESNLFGALTGIAVIAISLLVSLPRLREMDWPDWEKESYPDARDLMMIPLFAMVFPTVRYCFDLMLDVSDHNLSSSMLTVVFN